MFDVLVIGGGVIGCSVLRELSRYQLKIALLEKENDVAMGATKANSAIVHGGYAESHETVKGRLCYKGRKEFMQLDKELHFGFKPIGSLVLAFDKEQKPGLEKLLENGKANGLTDLSILNKEEILALEPNINPQVEYALFCKGAGVCSPFELAVALAENAITNGAQVFLEEEVVSIKKEKGFFALTTKKGNVYKSKTLVNAAGLYADKVAQMAGDNSFTVHPRSGEYILLNKDSGQAVNTVLFQMPTKMGKGILVTPTVYGNLLIGPDAIDEEKADRDTHVERLYDIYEKALLTTEKIEINRFLRSFAGIRAVSSTDDFIIEESSVKGLINGAGIQSPGMTSSPAIAKLIVELLEKSGLALSPNPGFNPNRKPTHIPHPSLTFQELQPLLKLEEGEEGRRICRCGQVPEKDIVDAATRGIPLTSVDGIKRRTRAGMGQCQGQFCRPRTAKVLSNILGKEVSPQGDVEKDRLARVGRAEMLAYIKNRSS